MNPPYLKRRANRRATAAALTYLAFVLWIAFLSVMAGCSRAATTRDVSPVAFPREFDGITCPAGTQLSARRSGDGHWRVRCDSTRAAR